jgi:CRP/FNR family transcriptional regulator, cyclic AMP receptor protein
MSWEELQRVPLLAALPPARLREIAGRCPARQVPPGTVLARQGDPAENLIVVIHGELSALHCGVTGEHVRLPFAVASCILDKAAVLSGANHAVTWTARTHSVVRLMDRRFFQGLLAAEPSMRNHTLRYLSAQVMHAQRERIHRDTSNTPARIARWLLQHRGTQGPLIPLPAGQQGLAEELGLSRVTVNRVLQSLMRSGAVRIHRGAVQLLDADALSATASTEAAR